MQHQLVVPSPITIDRSSGRVLVGGPVAPVRRVHRPVPVRRAPNYAARRVGALGALIAALFVAAHVLVAGASFFEGSTAFADGSAGSPPVASTSVWSGPTHVAVAGDTLWSIAAAHGGRTARHVYIDALVELNGGTAITVGQAVRLPTAD